MAHRNPDSAIRLILDGRREREVRLSVWNAGAIPAEQLPQLFQPFRGTISKGSKGLGLGLYISEQIVKAHGGRISVLSTVLSGTTIEVELPRHRLTGADA